eukprot:scaffold143_cov260-Pinguiococcus_pyrenoidosus.AAC.61
MAELGALGAEAHQRPRETLQRIVSRQLSTCLHLHVSVPKSPQHFHTCALQRQTLLMTLERQEAALHAVAVAELSGGGALADDQQRHAERQTKALDSGA